MDPERWPQIERLLEESFDLDDVERAEFIEAECSGDPELRREIQELLEAEQRAPAFLEGDAVSFVAPALEDLPGDLTPSPAEPGRRLGAYKLIREIGHGGMSVVYLAERADGQFERKVAIKLLRHLGGTHEERVRRFVAERQILATLEHAHIARVYGGGVTKGGWPYLAMELVDGRPITEYCSEKGLSIAQRLLLFEDVCEAIEHAHRRLVVHRDLKPGNILVTEKGDVKLLDFGIAKLLDDDARASGGAPVTATGMRLLTPQYAAPEQVRGDTISTATDVYALGLLLFELLSGSRPYEVTGKSATEIERIVCEEEVTRPSTRIGTGERGGIPDSPSRQKAMLEGDLDTIVLKALRKNPADRYGSVQELRADLRRFRNGLPVRARPMTTGYRIRKFVNRNRIGVAVASLIALMLLSFAVVTLLQQQATERQRDQARFEARKATEVTDFLLSLFEANDPSETLGETPTALQLLERGVERAASLESQPAVRAEMLSVMGRAYRGLGEFARADSMIQMALKIRLRFSETNPETMARTVGELAQVKTDLAEYEAADSLFREALMLLPAGEDSRPGHGPRSDSLRALLNNNYAFLKQRQGDLAGAESLHTVVLELRRSRGGTEDLEVAQSLHNLAATQHQLGRYAVADSLYLEALAIRRAKLPGLHPALANTVSSLAANREQLGDYHAADSLYRIALNAHKKVLGPDHPDVATTAMQLANLLAGRARYEEAESLHLEVLESRKQRLGDHHPDVGESIFSLAYLVSQKGDYNRSISLYHEAVDLWLETLGAQHPYITLAYNNLAHVLARQGRWEESVEMNREVLRRNLQKFGDESPQVAVSLGNLGDGLVDLAEFEEAERRLSQSLELRRKLFGDMNGGTADSYSLLAKMYLRQGRYSEAEETGRRALAIRREVHGPSHPRVAYSLHGIAIALWNLGEMDEAAAYFEEGLGIRREALGDDHPETVRLVGDYLTFCETTGRTGKARELRNILGQGDE